MNHRKVYLLPFILFSAVWGEVLRVDTVGGTTYDLSTICAGVQRMIYAVPGTGVHVAWWWSREVSPWPDKNCRYNFFDARTGVWRYLDPDYMNSGINLFHARCNYGSIDYDITRSEPAIAFHYSAGGSTPRPAVALGDTISYAPEGYLWPWVGVTARGTVHLAVIDNATQNSLYWTRTRDLVNWTPPVPMGALGFPDHILIASKESERVGILWLPSPSICCTLYYRFSPDDGDNWSDILTIPAPPAFGGDTVTSFHISSLGARYTLSDSLSLVAAVHPVFLDTALRAPVELWFYNPGNSPAWSRVHRIDIAHLPHRLDYNSLVACRPRLTQDFSTGNFYVLWSQYDTANFEPQTGIMRADLWLASSHDQGRTWETPIRLTGPDSRTRLYFDVAPVVNDTLHLIWMEDLCAGMSVLGEGPVTNNPVIYRALPVTSIGVQERNASDAGAIYAPGTAAFGQSGHNKGRFNGGALIDISGRRMPDRARNLHPGVYFLKNETGGYEKVVIVR